MGAHEDILERAVEGVAKVEAVGDVWGREEDAEGLALAGGDGGGVGVADAGGIPLSADAGLVLGGDEMLDLAGWDRSGG